MVSVTGAGWHVCAASGSTWMGSNLKLIPLPLCFVFPPLFVLFSSQLRGRGLLAW